MAIRCETCRYYRQTRPSVESDVGHGECRRHAAPGGTALDIDTVSRVWVRWPLVLGDEWCGDHAIRGLGGSG